MKNSDYYLIGTIKKTKNSSGYWELNLQNSIEQLPPLEKIYILLHHTYVPFQVADFQEKGDKVQLIFQDDTIVNQYNAMKRKEVFLPQAIMEPHLADFPFGLVGYTVYDSKQGNSLGKVIEVIPRFLQPILSIVSEQEEMMIPFHEAFIAGIQHQQKKIRVTLPHDYLATIQESE